MTVRLPQHRLTVSFDPGAVPEGETHCELHRDFQGVFVGNGLLRSMTGRLARPTVLPRVLRQPAYRSREVVAAYRYSGHRRVRPWGAPS
jgi:hypothetical protein